MKIAILGCGYVGAEFARQAKAAGHDILGVVRSEASRDKLRGEGITAEAFDLQAGDWALLPKQFDAVVYAASTGGGGPEAYALAYDVGVKRALVWARAVGAQTFVFTSSTGVYRQDDGRIVDEESMVGGAPTADAILGGERAVLSSGFAKARVLRFGGLYGPGRHHMVDQLRRGDHVIGGRVDHYINYLHRDDAASSLLAAVVAGPAGARVYNVGDGHPVTKEGLACWIAERLGQPAPVFDPNAPAGPRVAKGGRTQPSRIVATGRIRSELGWRPAFSDVFAGLAPFLG
ncbi:MAG: NAD-dependent epimerase/dehydratase family protein [Verrucomicrobia bacterium]|nr:MAG: NAD-dependent epimerase/dehydratase family protein [Verrucomicrobiota bacterium]